MKPKDLDGLMKKMGLNSEQLADELEVHFTTVYRWRNGEKEIPASRAKMIEMLAREKGAA